MKTCCIVNEVDVAKLLRQSSAVSDRWKLWWDSCGCGDAVAESCWRDQFSTGAAKGVANRIDQEVACAWRG